MEAKRIVLINNLSNVENYLDINPTEEKLNFLVLKRNYHISGVKKLYNLIPNGFDPKKLKKFYQKTGLKILVEKYVNCDVSYCDRKGYYPRPDAYIWNEDFINGLKDHPEWLEPQESPDIIVRYIVNEDNYVEEDSCKEDDEENFDDIINVF